MYDITVLVSILLSLYVKNAVDKVGRIFHADVRFGDQDSFWAIPRYEVEDVA